MTIKHLKRKLNFKIFISIITALTIVAIVSVNIEPANAEVIVIPSSLGGSATVTFNTVGLGSEYDGQLISRFTINWHTSGEGNITVPGGTIDDVKEKSMFEGTFFSPITSSSPDMRYILQSVTGSAQETSPVIWWGPRVTDSSWALYLDSSTATVIVTITYSPQYKVTFDASANVKADSTTTILTVNGTALTASDLPYTTDWVSQGDKLAWAYSEHVASTSDPTNVVYSCGSASGLGQTGKSGILTVNSPGTITGAYIKQVHNTFRANGLSGTDYVTLTGTSFGVSGSLCNLSASNNWQSNVYSDYNTPITFSGASHNSGTTERWALQNALPYAIPVLTTSGGTYSQTYYHQYAFIFDYAVIGGGGTDPALDAPILSGTSAGEVGYINNILPLHGAAVVPLWLDAGTTWQLSSQLRRSTATERWLTNQITTGTVNAPVTATYTYYHQIKAQVNYAYSSGTCTNDMTGTLFGNSGITLATLNSSNGWSSQLWQDFNTYLIFPAASTPVNGERWQYFSSPIEFLGTTGGTTYTVLISGIHQYQVTFNYNVAGSGSLDNDPIVYYTKFGAACNATALTYSGPADWVDAGTSVSYQNNILSIGYYPLWQINLPVTDGKSVIPNPINQAVTLNPTYYKRAELKINIDGITGLASLNIYGTSFGVPNTLIMTLNETNDWSASAWVDDGTDVTLPAAAYVNENERWMLSLNMGQDYTFTVDVAAILDIDSFYVQQYRNLYIATGLSGDDAIYITGTYLGESRSIATLYSSNSWTAFGWSDIGTTATYPATSTQSNTQERWTIGNPYTTDPITFGGGFYGQAYTHQYNVTFQYSTSDGKAIPNGTVIGSYTKFGQTFSFVALPQYQTTLPSSDWVDAQTQVLLKNYTDTSNTNRWILTDSPSEITVTTSGNLNVGTYYHQVLITLTATGLSGTDCTEVQGTYCGKNAIIAILNSSNSWNSSVWSDSGTTVTFQGTSDNSGVDERWILDDNSVIMADDGLAIVKEYIHQCRIVFSVVGDGLTRNSGIILTVNGEKLTGTQLPYQTQWVTTGSQLSFAYQKVVANANDSRYFWTGTSGYGQSGQTGALTVTGPGTVTATYGIEYAVTTKIVGNGTITPTTTYYTKGASQTFTITPQKGYHIANVTIDDQPVDPISTIPLSDIQAGHKITVIFTVDQNPDDDVNPSPSPTASPKNSPSNTNSMVMLSVFGSLVLLGSLLVFGCKRSKN